MEQQPVRRGRELLAAALERTGVKKFRLEQEMDVGGGLVSRWLKGERTPGLAEAKYLERRFGIPVEEWLTPSELEAIERASAASDRPSATGTNDA